MTCGVCGRELTYNEAGLSCKFAGGRPHCLGCLSEALNVPAERLLQKVEEYLSAGCLLFVREETSRESAHRI